MADSKGRDGGVGDQAIRAISHPIRIEVLRALQDRVASPKELAKELGESVSNVSYHFKYLRLEGCIEILDTVPRRGAIEHYYRAKPPPEHDEESWSELPHAVRAEISSMEIRNLLGEAVRALNAGTFDARDDRRLDWTSMELDKEGWRELTERQSEWAEELERIRAEAAVRLVRDGTSGSSAVAGMMCFETPSDSGLAKAGGER